MKYVEIPIDSEIDNIICFYHDVTHLRVNTTIDSIRNKYDWKGIHENVSEYVSLSILSKLSLTISNEHNC